MKNQNYLKNISLAGIPALYALICLCTNALMMSLITFLLVFVVVAFLPVCRRRESLWLFLISMAASVPVNILLLKQYEYVWACFIPLENTGKGFLYYMCAVEALLILNSVEEIAIGIVGRVIWRRQYRFLNVRNRR